MSLRMFLTMRYVGLLWWMDKHGVSPKSIVIPAALLGAFLLGRASTSWF